MKWGVKMTMKWQWQWRQTTMNAMMMSSAQSKSSIMQNKHIAASASASASASSPTIHIQRRCTARRMMQLWNLRDDEIARIFVDFGACEGHFSGEVNVLGAKAKWFCGRALHNDRTRMEFLSLNSGSDAGDADGRKKKILPVIGSYCNDRGPNHAHSKWKQLWYCYHRINDDDRIDGINNNINNNNENNNNNRNEHQ
jgi:hypothetical protein